MFAVPDADRGVGIEVQHRTIRQAASQLFAVPCLKMQRRHAVRRRTGVPIGLPVPCEVQADTQEGTRRHHPRRRKPAARRADPKRIARRMPKRTDARLLGSVRTRQNRLQGILRVSAGLAQVTRDHRHAEEFLNVNRRGLEPRRQVRGFLYIVQSLVMAGEPVAGLFGDGSAYFLIVGGHGFNLAAPCGVCSDRAPGPHTSWPSEGISPDAVQFLCRRVLA